MKELIENLLKLQTLEFNETADARTAGRIAELRGKKGVAAVRNQICTGCHMQVPLAVVMTLMHGDDIRICENCGRYLHLPEVTETEKAKRGKKPAGAGKQKPELQTA